MSRLVHDEIHVATTTYGYHCWDKKVRFIWDCLHDRFPADTICRINVGLTLVRSLRRWPNVIPILIRPRVSAGWPGIHRSIPAWIYPVAIFCLFWKDWWGLATLNEPKFKGVATAESVIHYCFSYLCGCSPFWRIKKKYRNAAIVWIICKHTLFFSCVDMRYICVVRFRMDTFVSFLGFRMNTFVSFLGMGVRIFREIWTKLTFLPTWEGSCFWKRTVISLYYGVSHRGGGGGGLGMKW